MTDKVLVASPDQTPAEKDKGPSCVVSRREFLFSAAAATAVSMTITLPGYAAAPLPATAVTYPRKLIGKLSELKVDAPISFNYPDDKSYSSSMLVMLGTEAGGGVGNNKDVVAFNYTCTHQGGPLQGTYQAADKALGPCPLHLTTYDLTRHGIVVSGNAYQSLPQVLLEVDGDDIYAIGIFGLVFGRYDNLEA